MLAAPDMPDFDVRAGDTELKRIYLFSRFRGVATPVAGRPGVRPGQALLDAAVEDARAMGSRRMILGTNAGNERAIAFYLHNGFTEAGSRTFQVGTQRCCDLIFAKVL
jgi:GNAT superfamily N-acetyltransferase